MDCFMIGNGFDLHYGLPTAYTSFLQVVNYLCKKITAGEMITSVAQVFASEELCDSDWAIKNCYAMYGKNYDATLGNEVAMMVDLAQNNFWISYLVESHRLHPKWVDFESEIAKVLSTLSNCFDKTENINGYFVLKITNKADIFVLRRLEYLGSAEKKHLFSELPEEHDGTKYFLVEKDYLAHEPEGSSNIVVNWKKISDCLFSSLRDLADVLAIYLDCFVSKPLDNLIKKGLVKKDYLLMLYEKQPADQLSWRTNVVSFNYTQTWEKLYPGSVKRGHRPAYVHGKLEQASTHGIVLGINSDKSDELGTIDTTFLPFKKYYQRVLYNTDQLNHDDIDQLSVIGHSLDITDQEIIKDLFHRANNIIIYYHSISAMQDYITNLVKIFGRSGLEEKVRSNGLRFRDIKELSVQNPLPKTISLFHILNIQNANELDLSKRWATAKCNESLSVPIGVSENGVFTIDLHEKHDGPHGLIAGTTGSGKTEFLLTYVISMATHFSPNEVNFLLMDFKGGGLVHTFRNLPHVIGTLTSFDANNLEHVLDALKEELIRRRTLFNNAMVDDIDEYILNYHNGIIHESAAHIFLIIDEFAELKVTQPEFFSELLTFAIPRLGIHLILTTQKPSGVVSDRIWSLTSTRLCFRTKYREDSMEMLKNPLAAKIVEPGRGYLQVGNDNALELFQTAYSMMRKPSEKESSPKTQLEEIVEQIHGYCEESHLVIPPFATAGA